MKKKPTTYVESAALRLIPIKRAIPKKEALATRAEDIRYWLAKLRCAKQELFFLRRAPLVRFYYEFKTVKPGDSRYDKATSVFESFSLPNTRKLKNLNKRNHEYTNHR